MDYIFNRGDNVYLACRTVCYEGTDILSVHATEEGARKVLEKEAEVDEEYDWIIDRRVGLDEETVAQHWTCFEGDNHASLDVTFWVRKIPLQD